MKKRIMVLIAITVFVFAGAVLLSSCANNYSNGGAIGNEGVEVEDSNKNEDVSPDAEAPIANDEGGTGTEEQDANGSDGVDEVTSSPNKTATLQEIEDMNTHLEQLLNDNYEVFSQIVDFFEKAPEEYFCWLEDGEIVVLYRALPNGPHVYVDLSEVEIGDQIAYVINDLGFLAIHEDGDISVTFEMRYYDRHPFIARYSQGLVCNKSTAVEFKVREWEPNSFEGIKHIRDEWFRYLIFYGD